MSSHETADDPATRALIELTAPYDCTVTVDEESMSIAIVGPPGTCGLSQSVHEDDELGFVVGEAATWFALYIGDASAAERAEIAADIVSAVLSGRISEDIWTRDGKIVRSQVTFLDTGEKHHWQVRFGGSGAPDRRITYSAYPLRTGADH